MNISWVRKAAEWLTAVQLPNGGWGETCATYEDPSLKGQGPATPSQTAWALLGLMAAGRGETPAVVRGVSYLLTTQRVDGTWEETACTGTGFPGVYYLTYGLYRAYFPLMALGLFQRLVVAPQAAAAERI
jgi:squalene-hopene/tetraprenyl-beta-curcumene cyclase